MVVTGSALFRGRNGGYNFGVPTICFLVLLRGVICQEEPALHEKSMVRLTCGLLSSLTLQSTVSQGNQVSVTQACSIARACFMPNVGEERKALSPILDDLSSVDHTSPTSDSLTLTLRRGTCISMSLVHMKAFLPLKLGAPFMQRQRTCTHC